MSAGPDALKCCDSTAEGCHYGYGYTIVSTDSALLKNSLFGPTFQTQNRVNALQIRMRRRRLLLDRTFSTDPTFSTTPTDSKIPIAAEFTESKQASQEVAMHVMRDALTVETPI